MSLKASNYVNSSIQEKKIGRIHGHARKVGVKCVKCEWKKTNNLLVKRITGKERYSCIIPMTMNKEGTLKILKFCEGEIRSSICCISFMSNDTDPYMGFLDHRDVISDIANCSSKVDGTKKENLNYEKKT